MSESIELLLKKQRWDRVSYGKDRSRQNQRHVKPRFRIYWTVGTDRHGGQKVWNCVRITMCLEMHFGGHRKWEISIDGLPKLHTNINKYKKFITRRHWFVNEFHRFWPWVNIHNRFGRWKPAPPHGRVGTLPQQQRFGVAGSQFCNAKKDSRKQKTILARLLDR